MTDSCLAFVELRGGRYYAWRSSLTATVVSFFFYLDLFKESLEPGRLLNDFYETNHGCNKLNWAFKID